MISCSRCLSKILKRALMAFFVDICISPPHGGARQARGRATRDEADSGVVLTACCPAGQSRISIPRFEAALSPHSCPAKPSGAGLRTPVSLSFFLPPAPRALVLGASLAHVAGVEPATVPRGLPGRDSNPLSVLPGQDACSPPRRTWAMTRPATPPGEPHGFLSPGGNLSPTTAHSGFHWFNIYYTLFSRPRQALANFPPGLMASTPAIGPSALAASVLLRCAPLSHEFAPPSILGLFLRAYANY